MNKLLDLVAMAMERLMKRIAFRDLAILIAIALLATITALLAIGRIGPVEVWFFAGFLFLAGASLAFVRALRRWTLRRTTAITLFVVISALSLARASIEASSHQRNLEREIDALLASSLPGETPSGDDSPAHVDELLARAEDADIDAERRARLLLKRADCLLWGLSNTEDKADDLQDRCRQAIERAFSLARSCSDTRAEGLYTMGLLHRVQGDLEGAAEFLRRAAAVSSTDTTRVLIWISLGEILKQSPHQRNEGRQYMESAKALAGLLRDRRIQAAVLFAEAGYDEDPETYDRAATLFQQMNNRNGELACRVHSTMLRFRQGKCVEADATRILKEVLIIFDASAGSITANAAGEVCFALAKLALLRDDGLDADFYLTLALEKFRTARNIRGQANCCLYRGRILREFKNEVPASIECFEKAREFFDSSYSGTGRAWAILEIGSSYLRMHDTARAERSIEIARTSLAAIPTVPGRAGVAMADVLAAELVFEVHGEIDVFLLSGLKEAIANLREIRSAPDSAWATSIFLRGLELAAEATLRLESPDYGHARQLASEAVAVAREAPSAPARVGALVLYEGLALEGLKDVEAARKRFIEAADLGGRGRDPRLTARSLENQARLERDPNERRRILRQTLQIYRRLNDTESAERVERQLASC